MEVLPTNMDFRKLLVGDWISSVTVEFGIEATQTEREAIVASNLENVHTINWNSRQAEHGG